MEKIFSDLKDLALTIAALYAFFLVATMMVDCSRENDLARHAKELRERESYFTTQCMNHEYDLDKCVEVYEKIFVKRNGLDYKKD